MRFCTAELDLRHVVRFVSRSGLTALSRIMTFFFLLFGHIKASRKNEIFSREVELGAGEIKSLSFVLSPFFDVLFYKENKFDDLIGWERNTSLERFTIAAGLNGCNRAVQLSLRL